MTGSESRVDVEAVEQEAAAARLAGLLSPAGIDRLLADAEASGTPLDGVDGLINQLTKAVIERALGVEMADHVGYEKGDPAGRGSGNSRNGSYPKTVTTTAGPVRFDVPRDRNGTFAPKIVEKGRRRLGQVDDMILSLYARGMTTRDIKAHLSEVYGAEVSPDLVSRVTDVVTDEITAWQTRPTDRVYVICYIDAVVVKIRTDGHVSNRPAYIVTGVDVDGFKHVLGIWIGPSEGEGAKFWLSVLTELRNRGTEDVLIVCCDGLTGFADAIEATWTQAIVQTCVVHLIRAAMRFVNYKDRKTVAAALKPIYQATDATTARAELDDFTRSELGHKYPTTVATFTNAWERFIPFLAFPPELRRVIYTTNSIESLNYQLRKIIKNRGHFPNDDAVVKLLWLAICNIEDKRAREREKERGRPPNERRASGRLVEGQVTTNWKQALAQLALAYPDRINQYL
jgi:transposase-like protein